jgi:hypothetical protein
VRLLNAIGRLVPRFGRYSADAWWAAARKGDLANCDPTPEAREALEALVDSIESDVRLNLVGRFSVKSDTVRMARTHLRVRRALRETPEIAGTSLPPPLFIVGWPRTGTTFLHQLLSRDPTSRTIPYWESFDPVPPLRGPDRRIERLGGMLRQLEQIAPNYQAIHPMEPELAEECVALFMNELRSLQFDFQYRAPGYVGWLLEQDPRIAYDAYRRQLQLIQFHRPCGERFVLKDPTHLVHLETLIELFPDARFIFIHRDPAKAISSICSLTAYTRAIFSDEVDPWEIGAEVLNGYWPLALERAQSIRSRLAPGRSADIRHADLSRDPVGTVEETYRALGLSLGDAAGAAMMAFLERGRSRPKGAHVHTPEGFGLRAEAIRERFKAYCETFDL